MWEESGSKPGPKILNANAQVTFERGRREWIIEVRIDETAPWRVSGRASYHNENGGVTQYRFANEQEALECAGWLVGREHVS